MSHFNHVQKVKSQSFLRGLADGQASCTLSKPLHTNWVNGKHSDKEYETGYWEGMKTTGSIDTKVNGRSGYLCTGKAPVKFTEMGDASNSSTWEIV